jgi:biopolymer transport protein ExbD
MAASAESENGDMGFQIAPMVDVVFVLLLFFIAIAAFKPQEYMLNANLPAGPGRGGPPIGVIRIDITEAGVVSVNDTKCGEAMDHTLPELRAWLKNVISYGSTDPVLIHPAPGTEQGRITDVLAACADEKVKNVAFN